MDRCLEKRSIGEPIFPPGHVYPHDALQYFPFDLRIISIMGTDKSHCKVEPEKFTGRWMNFVAQCRQRDPQLGADLADGRGGPTNDATQIRSTVGERRRSLHSASPRATSRTCHSFSFWTCRSAFQRAVLFGGDAGPVLTIRLYPTRRPPARGPFGLSRSSPRSTGPCSCFTQEESSPMLLAVHARFIFRSNRYPITSPSVPRAVSTIPSRLSSMTSSVAVA